MENGNPNLQLPYLDEGMILQEIIARLPLKSVLRFKCISQSWCQTIASREFAAAFLSKSMDQSSFIHSALVFEGGVEGNNQGYVLYDDGSESDTCIVSLPPIYSDSVKFYNSHLVGVSNGLICLLSDKFNVWNPSNGEIYGIVIPFASGKWFFGAAGFCSITIDKYKIIQIDTSCFVVNIYTSNMDDWNSKSDKFDNLYPFKFVSVFGLEVDKNLYWIVRKREHNAEEERFILGFDIHSETFYKHIKLGKQHTCLFLMGGYLSCIGVDSLGEMCIDMFRERQGVMSIQLGGFKRTVQSCLGFTRQGRFYLLDMSGNLLEVDPSRPKKFVKRRKFIRNSAILKYVPSFLSPYPHEGETSR